MINLTGGVVVHRHPQKEKESPQRFFERVSAALADGAVLAASASTPEARKKGQKLGLMTNHAYALLKVRCLQDGDKAHALLHLRNPWGSFEWKGAWADGDAHWTPELRAAAEQNDREDGCFWMELADFWRFFDAVHVLRVLPDSWSRHVIHSDWDASHCGGCMSGQNRVFALWADQAECSSRQAPQQLTLYATLSVPTRVPTSTAAAEQVAVGLTAGVLGTPIDPGMRKGPTSALKVLAQTPSKPERDVSMEITLAVQPDGAPTFLVPSTQHAGVTGKFRLTLQANGPVKVREVSSADGGAALQAWAHGRACAEARGEWRGAAAGGPMAANIDRWAANPQFALEWERGLDISVLIGLGVPTAAAIAPYIHSKKKPSKPAGEQTRPLLVNADAIMAGAGAKVPLHRIVVAEPPWDELADGYMPFVADGFAWYEYKLGKEGMCVIVPHTGKHGEENQFVLRVIAWPVEQQGHNSAYEGMRQAGGLRLRLLDDGPPEAATADSQLKGKAANRKKKSVKK